MSAYLKKIKDEIILIVILLIAAIMRFNNYSELSLTGDEIGAINLIYDSAVETIEKGVGYDYHPAGVLLFLHYWTKIGGTEEWWLRLPFVICGILSVLFSYLIGRRWFGKQAGLFFASSLCFLEFPLTYSQIARPYSPGLLFSLMSVFFWTKLLFDTGDTKKIITIIGYVIATALSAYTHYFSFMLVVIAGLCGLFFMKKNNYKTYLLSALVIALIFLPHLGLTIDDLNKGGFSGHEPWTGYNFKEVFEDFFRYCLNDSQIMYISFGGILFASLIFNFQKIKVTKFHLITLVMGIMPFLITWIYSTQISLVFTTRNMLFSFPYLIVFFFSFTQYQEKKTPLYILLGLFTLCGLYSTVAENKFYKTHHFGALKEIVLKTIEWSDKYGDANITKALNPFDDKLLDYYFKKYGIKKDFVKDTVKDKDERQKFVEIVKNANTPYFLYAWTSTWDFFEINRIICEKYPYVVEKQYYFNSEIHLYGKERAIDYSEPVITFKSKYDFENTSEHWRGDESQITSEVVFAENKSSVLEKEEFSYTLSLKAPSMLKSHNDLINISVWGMLPDSMSDAKLAISFTTPTGEIYGWHDMKFSVFIKELNKWRKIYLSCRVPAIKSLDDKINIFVWNVSKGSVYIDDFEVVVEESNPYLYGRRRIKIPLSQKE